MLDIFVHSVRRTGGLVVWWIDGCTGIGGIYHQNDIIIDISGIHCHCNCEGHRSIAGIGRGIGDNIKWHKECLA